MEERERIPRRVQGYRNTWRRGAAWEDLQVQHLTQRSPGGGVAEWHLGESTFFMQLLPAGRQALTLIVGPSHFSRMARPPAECNQLHFVPRL